MTQQLSREQLTGRVKEKLVSGEINEDQARQVLQAWRSQQAGEAESKPPEPEVAGAAPGGPTQEQKEQLRRADIESIPEALSFTPSGLLAGQNPAKVAAMAPILTMTTDPVEMGQILSQQFEPIGIVHTPEGEVIAVNNETGARAVLNKPGLSQQDVLQFLGIAGAYTPAGKVAGAGLKALGKGAGAAAATQTGIEAGQALAGGEFDPGEVALSAGTQAGGQAAGEILSGLLRGTLGRVSQNAEELVKTGEKYDVPILTSDALPPSTYAGKSAQTLFERIPIVGTSGRRALQQEAREGAVQRFAAEFGVSPEIPFNEEVIKSLDTVKAAKWRQASRLKNAARQALSETGEQVPRSNFQEAIDEAIETEMKFGTQADEGLLRSLAAWKEAPPGDFGYIDELRSRLGDEISDFYTGKNTQIGKKGVQYLQRMKNALTEDMERFAKNSDVPEAYQQWQRANRMFTEEYGKFQASALKGLLDKGEIEPERVTSILSGSRPSKAALLYQNLTPKGRANAKGAILQNMMEKATNNQGVVDPDRLLTQMKRMDKPMQIFFRGDDGKALQGFRELLRNTQRAGRSQLATPTGQELYYLGLGGTAVASPPAAAGMVGAASLGKIYETGPVRNAMLKLANTPPRSPKYDQVLREAQEALTTAAQAERQRLEEDE